MLENVAQTKTLRSKIATLSGEICLKKNSISTGHSFRPHHDLTGCALKTVSLPKGSVGSMGLKLDPCVGYVLQTYLDR